MSKESNHPCKCDRPAGSIHGTCNKCYGKLGTFNQNSEEPKKPTTARGLRRSQGK